MDTETHDNEAFKRLWIAVVIQAIEDLTILSTKQEDVLARNQAFNWFRSNSADFKETCLNADIEPEWLRSKIRNASPKQLRYLINEYRGLI